MNKTFEKPEFKDCSCGSKLRLVWLDHPDFPRVDIGLCECSHCSESHYVMLGDDLDVRACAEDMKAFYEARGKGVDCEQKSFH